MQIGSGPGQFTDEEEPLLPLLAVELLEPLLPLDPVLLAELTLALEFADELVGHDIGQLRSGFQQLQPLPGQQSGCDPLPQTGGLPEHA